MGSIAASLETMGIGQVLLVFVFLGCYASALSQTLATRARLVTINIGIFAATGFVSLNDPWETGVCLLALVPVGMGVFAAAAWLMWKALGETPRPAIPGAPAQHVGAVSLIGFAARAAAGEPALFLNAVELPIRAGAGDLAGMTVTSASTWNKDAYSG
jgi:hypothetical protein